MCLLKEIAHLLMSQVSGPSVHVTPAPDARLSLLEVVVPEPLFLLGMPLSEHGELLNVPEMPARPDSYYERQRSPGNFVPPPLFGPRPPAK